MISIARRIEFDAAHRVMEHESKCRHLHGHRYVLEASFAAETLDSLGRVIDFGQIREILGGWIDANWDHNTILHQADRSLGEGIARTTGQRIFYLPANPTAENMALYLHQQICPMLFKDLNVTCTHLRLWETPNCYAETR